MGNRIPVTIVTGFLGSGKTTLLNRLLAVRDVGEREAAAGLAGAATTGIGGFAGDVLSANMAGAADCLTVAAHKVMVLVEGEGGVAVMHDRVRHFADSSVASAPGCVCCAVRGELTDALRQLFMDALQRRIPGFSHVFIETAGLADPASVMYTLQYEPFLRDRYVYGGCIAVIDGVRGERDLVAQPEAARQAVLADALVISRRNAAPPEAQASLLASLHSVNPGAPILAEGQLGEIAALAFGVFALRQTSRMPQTAMPRAAGASLWARGGLGRSVPKATYTGIQTLAVQWKTPPARSEVLRAIETLQRDDSLGLLRLTGQMRFARDDNTWRLRGVHGQLYPMERAESAQAGTQDRRLEVGRAQPPGTLVLVFRPINSADLSARILSILPPGATRLSPCNNFPSRTVAFDAS